MENCAVKKVLICECRNLKAEYIWNIVLSIMFILGTGISFYPVLPQNNRLFFAVFVAVTTTMISATVSVIEKKIKYAHLAYISLTIIVAVVMYSYTVNGLCLEIDGIILLYNNAFSDAVELLAARESDFSVAFFACLSAVWLSEFVWYCVKSKRVFSLFVYIAIVIIANIVLKIEHKEGIALLCSAWSGIWFLYVAGRLYMEHILWVTCTVVVLLLAVLFTNKDDVRMIKDTQEEMEKAYEQLRYGSDGLPHGDLRDAYKMFDEEKERLHIDTKYISTMYLKGFVGGYYEDGKWSELHKAAYKGKNNGIIQWLMNNDFDPNMQYHKYDELSSENSQNADVSVTNNNAYRKYIYMPYSAIKVESNSFANKDCQYVSGNFEGSEWYEFEHIPLDLPSELIYNEDWLQNPSNDEQKKYVETEAIYKDFVYNNYLNEDENYSDIFSELFKGENEIGDETIYSATEKIRRVLAGSIKYTKNPTSVPRDADPIRYVFEQSKEGNAPFFASAAVFAYRNMGIPARYAEGYLVTDTSLVDSKGHVQLTDDDAHAWAEVYMDGVGWLPVDVTPGYYFDMSVYEDTYKYADNGNNEIDDEAYYNSADNDGGGDDKDIIKSVFTFPTGWFYCILTVLLLLSLLIFAILEIQRQIRRRYTQKIYMSLDEREKMLYAFKKICCALEYMGITVDLDKDHNIVDSKLTERFEDFRKNEYNRVYSLIEKVVYGEQELEPYEKRVITGFTDKIINQISDLDIKIKFKLRYFI